MAIARKVDLFAFSAADLKFVLSLAGVDMTGRSGTFHIARAPEQSPLIAATVTLLEVIEDDDGVPVSVIEAFASKGVVTAAKASLAPADEGADIPLYFEFRVSALGGDLGTAAETTLLYGPLVLKGSI